MGHVVGVLREVGVAQCHHQQQVEHVGHKLTQHQAQPLNLDPILLGFQQGKAAQGTELHLLQKQKTVILFSQLASKSKKTFILLCFLTLIHM